MASNASPFPKATRHTRPPFSHQNHQRFLSLWQHRRTRLHSPQLLLPFPTSQQRLYSRSRTAACKKIGVMIRALTNFLFYRKGRRFP
ncbi:hypothetical protein V6N13_140237 [Hibiscus sabdariffa]